MTVYIDTIALIAGALVIGPAAGYGVLGSDVPASGISGPSFLYNDLTEPGDLTAEVRGEILAFPPVGAFFAYSNGSFTYTGPSTTFSYQFYVNNVPRGGLKTVQLGVGAQPPVRNPEAIYTIDLIRRAMLLAKILAGSEVPETTEANDALATLNEMLGNWTVNPLTLWGSENQVFTLKAGKSVYTVGPGGDFDTERPQSVDEAFITYQGFDLPAMYSATESQWNSIATKNFTSFLPSAMYYINDNPLGILKVWPVPSGDLPITISAKRLMKTVPNIFTELVFPPGAMIALRFELAVLLSIEHGSPIDRQTVMFAEKYKADFKRSNRINVVAKFDSALVPDQAGRGNILSGWM
jgi:hypothetical protein